MLSTTISMVRDVWRYFTLKPEVKSDDEILQDCIKAYEDEVKSLSKPDSQTTYLQSGCKKCTGKITSLTDSYGVIDGRFEFTRETSSHLNLKTNDIIYYLVFQLSERDPPKVARVLSILENFGDNDNEDSTNFIRSQYVEETYNIVERVMLGKVLKREGRYVTMEPNNLRFSLDTVVSNFLPIVGDWIEVFAKVQQEKDVKFGTDAGHVLEVTKIRTLRSEMVEGTITKWDKKLGWGIIDNRIFFNESACNINYNLRIGEKVIVDAIESDQGKLSWRAVSLVVLFSVNKDIKKKVSVVHDDNKNCVVISSTFDFENMNVGEKKELQVDIKNGSDIIQYLSDVINRGNNKKFSQVQLIQTHNEIVILKPKESISLIFVCTAKYYGRTSESFTFIFKGFNIKREFLLNVVDPKWKKTEQKHFSSNYHLKTKYILDNIVTREGNPTRFIPGRRSCKPPPFIKVRTPQYAIPRNCWKIFQEGSQKLLHGNDELLHFAENLSLSSNINITNYTERFHTLLFIEEMQYAIKFKMYDMETTNLVRQSQYLCLTIEGLYEKRPSLLVGDSVKVDNPWSENSPRYEGFIHKLAKDTLFLQFSNDFHEKYNGEDVSVEFFFSRSSFQKCHFGIDLASTHLGPQILFPDKTIINPNQLQIEEIDSSDNNLEETNSILDNNRNLTVDPEANKIKKVKWFNKNLNDVQKNAVLNVLSGVTKPLPYIIFGPPGTGKTITLVEVIIQIVTIFPNSRILIATPSNSAANLLTQRLIESSKFHPGFLIRLVSLSHISSGNLPDCLKPYCATLNVSSEKSNKSNFRTSSEGIRYECNKSFIGRHRITIGTCVCLGSLVRMGFPAGHFSHVLVDEAGQATEPEAMIPLGLIDKSHGQIIMAGDPMQLGPVVISYVAKRLGLNQSYLERILKCYPYLKDFVGFGEENGGYDPRLITKLKYNYRSLQSIINFSSKTFYDSGVISMLSSDNAEIQQEVNKLSQIFDLNPNEYKSMFFHGVRGTNYRGQEDPSWFNPQEAANVLIYLCKLYKGGYAPDDIGIITPYIQQVKHIRALVDDLGIECPKIGTVEEFQGQEKKIIILSIVRSNESLVSDDAEKSLGFIRQPKRMNVAFTRAQYMLIIFGNPHLLCLDALWNELIRDIVSNGGYIGCDLPNDLF